jgi:hypothetical protein
MQLFLNIIVLIGEKMKSFKQYYAEASVGQTSQVVKKLKELAKTTKFSNLNHFIMLLNREGKLDETGFSKLEENEKDIVIKLLEKELDPHAAEGSEQIRKEEKQKKAEAKKPRKIDYTNTKEKKSEKDWYHQSSELF